MGSGTWPRQGVTPTVHLSANQQMIPSRLHDLDRKGLAIHTSPVNISRRPPQYLSRIAYVRGRDNRTCPYNRQRTSAPLDRTSACTMLAREQGGDNLLWSRVNVRAIQFLAKHHPHAFPESVSSAARSVSGIYTAECEVRVSPTIKAKTPDIRTALALIGFRGRAAVRSVILHNIEICCTKQLQVEQPP
jgi:hypothetical protein